jgi:hypothetical protein
MASPTPEFSVATDEQAAAERVLAQGLLTESDQAVRCAAEIRRLHGHQDPHRRRNPDHGWPSRKLRASAAKSGASKPLSSTRILDPAASCSSRTQCPEAFPAGSASPIPDPPANARTTDDIIHHTRQ